MASWQVIRRPLSGYYFIFLFRVIQVPRALVARQDLQA